MIAFYLKLLIWYENLLLIPALLLLILTYWFFWVGANMWVTFEILVKKFHRKTSVLEIHGIHDVLRHAAILTPYCYFLCGFNIEDSTVIIMDHFAQIQNHSRQRYTKGKHIDKMLKKFVVGDFYLFPLDCISYTEYRICILFIHFTFSKRS
jgi:hypothetical protein